MPPDILVFQRPDATHEPLISPALIDRALEADPAAAAAEYLAEFRSDIETFVRREAVDACVMAGCYECAARPSQWTMRRVWISRAGGKMNMPKQ